MVNANNMVRLKPRLDGGGVSIDPYSSVSVKEEGVTSMRGFKSNLKSVRVQLKDCKYKPCKSINQNFTKQSSVSDTNKRIPGIPYTAKSFVASRTITNKTDDSSSNIKIESTLDLNGKKSFEADALPIPKVTPSTSRDSFFVVDLTSSDDEMLNADFENSFDFIDTSPEPSKRLPCKRHPQRFQRNINQQQSPPKVPPSITTNVTQSYFPGLDCNSDIDSMYDSIDLQNILQDISNDNNKIMNQTKVNHDFTKASATKHNVYKTPSKCKDIDHNATNVHDFDVIRQLGIPSNISHKNVNYTSHSNSEIRIDKQYPQGVQKTAKQSQNQLIETSTTNHLTNTSSTMSHEVEASLLDPLSSASVSQMDEWQYVLPPEGTDLHMTPPEQSKKVRNKWKMCARKGKIMLPNLLYLQVRAANDLKVNFLFKILYLYLTHY